MITDFWKGVILGTIASAVIAGVIAGLVYSHNRDKEIVRYAEKRIEIEAVREEYRNRDPDEFIDDIPDVRRAADGATAEFERKRDEALQRFRNKLAD
jgi:hypothetical protein